MTIYGMLLGQESHIGQKELVLCQHILPLTLAGSKAYLDCNLSKKKINFELSYVKL